MLPREHPNLLNSVAKIDLSKSVGALRGIEYLSNCSSAGVKIIEKFFHPVEITCNLGKCPSATFKDDYGTCIPPKCFFGKLTDELQKSRKKKPL